MNACRLIYSTLLLPWYTRHKQQIQEKNVFILQHFDILFTTHTHSHTQMMVNSGQNAVIIIKRNE